MTYERPEKTGLRKIGHHTLYVDDLTDSFTGLPDDTSRTHILAAFKRAAPYLGISPALRDTVDLLFAYSNEKDWESGRKPIVWPSNRTLQDDLSLSLRAVQNRLRELEQRGLIAVVESANGKRYGRRNPKGYIIEAFGFDLSPLAARREEFFQIIEQGQAERAERDSLRRSITIKRKAIAQIAHSALDSGYDGADWTNMIRIAAAAAAPAAYSNQILHLRDILAVLTNLHDEAEKAWRVALEAVQLANDPCLNDVDTASEGAANCTHIQLQKNPPSFKKDTSRATPPARQKDSRCSGGQPKRDHNHPRCGTIDEHVKRYRLNPALISELFPELGLTGNDDCLKWADIHDAASALSSCLGISHHAWSDACRLIGRNGASIAVALIAAKNEEIRSPGGYLRKMAARAETGDLHLGPSVFAIRDKRQAPDNL